MAEAKSNTDREIWREHNEDYYSPSIFVTERGGIGINVGGYVIVAPVKKWHDALRQFELTAPEAESPAVPPAQEVEWTPEEIANFDAQASEPLEEPTADLVRCMTQAECAQRSPQPAGAEPDFEGIQRIRERWNTAENPPADCLGSGVTPYQFWLENLLAHSESQLAALQKSHAAEVEKWKQVCRELEKLSQRPSNDEINYLADVWRARYPHTSLQTQIYDLIGALWERRNPILAQAVANSPNQPKGASHE